VSLINEALKRAREEAARQRAETAEGAWKSAPRHAPPPPRRSQWLSGLAVAVTALGVGGLLLLRWGPPEGDGPGPAPAVSEAEPAAVATEPGDSGPTSAPRAGDDGTRPASVVAADAARKPSAAPAGEPSPGLGGADGAEEQRGAEPAPRAASVVALASPATAPETPPPVAPEMSTPDELPPPLPGQTFLRVARLPGGVKLELAGIAWSSASPSAMLGGRIVSRGDIVEGYRVERIERNRVELVGRDDVAFFVRLREGL